MSLAFNLIPINVRTPGQYLEFDNSQAVQGLPTQPSKVLVLGQRLAGSTVAAAIPRRIYTAGSADPYFGHGSMLATMIAAFKAANPLTEIWAIALDDNPAGAAAVGSLAFAGSAPTETGSLYLYIGGRRVVCAIASGTSASAIATAVVAAINADKFHGCTAAVDGTVNTKVNITYNHKGLCGNSLDLRINYNFGEVLPAGTACAITAMAGGTANPDITVAIAQMAGATYATIVNPWTDATSLTAIETELAARWGPMVQREGQAISAISGSVGAMVNIGITRNCPQECIVGAAKSPTAPWIVASVVAAVDASEPDPARPRQTLVLPGVLPAWPGDRLGEPESESLLNSGIATLQVNAGSQVMIQRLITTYQLNASGFPDISYLDIETMRTLAYLRYSVRARIAARFPRHKLADDGTPVAPGQYVATPSLIKMELLHLAREWIDAGLMEDFDAYKAAILVVRNDSDPNRVDAILPPNVVNQFRVFAGSVQFIL